MRRLVEQFPEGKYKILEVKLSTIFKVGEVYELVHRGQYIGIKGGTTHLAHPPKRIDYHMNIIDGGDGTVRWLCTDDKEYTMIRVGDLDE